MTWFNVSGKMTLGIEERTFSKKVEAKSESMAKHKAYALLGSACGLPRNKIKIDKVEKATG
ncbi:MAG: 50S ribosomal protein L18Ae [Candidatus ainarchaeum sp.]|nr:50S ribosomal protein L18Ae [Candidatus ainarchaeum sp.]